MRIILAKRKRYGSGSLPPVRRIYRTGAPSQKKRRRRIRNRRGGIKAKLMRQPVPDKIITKLKYSEAVSLTLAAASTLGYYMYRTSLYDPDVTGLGHQPLWRDQLDYMYTKYRVHGIKYKFTIINTNVQQLTAGAVVMQPDSTAETNLNTIRERNNSRPFILPGYTGGNGRVVKGFMHTGYPHGLSKSDFLADEDFEAAMNANPVKTSILAIYCYTLNNGATINIQVDLTYYVELLGRIPVVGS